ncbi:MAG: phosphoribosyl-AMP cyclohydrolase [Chitinispirillaceae bacterium]|jgi:phosphoribosyl-AMP cyclohydrolase
MAIIDAIKFDEKGLVTAVAQDFTSDKVLMVACMNRETVTETLEKGVMVYYSRSRQKRWMKGESSGHIQKVREMYIDCDGDTLLFKIEQKGAACHENYFSCFFRKNINGKWSVVSDKIIKK